MQQDATSRNDGCGSDTPSRLFVSPDLPVSSYSPPLEDWNNGVMPPLSLSYSSTRFEPPATCYLPDLEISSPISIISSAANTTRTKRRRPTEKEEDIEKSYTNSASSTSLSLSIAPLPLPKTRKRFRSGFQDNGNSVQDEKAQSSPPYASLRDLLVPQRSAAFIAAEGIRRQASRVEQEQSTSSILHEFIPEKKPAKRSKSRRRNKFREERYPCPHCFKTFGRSYDAKRHVNSVHAAKVVCELCRANITSRNDALSRHESNACPFSRKK